MKTANLDCDPAVEQAWEQEVDRREAELASGKVTEVAGQVAINRLRARISGRNTGSIQTQKKTAFESP
jgi:Putative addiction module component